MLQEDASLSPSRYLFTLLSLEESETASCTGVCVCVCLGGELYTTTVADYRGNRPVISRHLSEGDHVDMKLDDTPGWLEG